MIDKMDNTTLRDAMYAMSLAKRVPDADLLEDFVRRYPQYADALTDFAVELAIDALSYGEEVDADLPPATEVVSPAVSHVMSRFQNRLFELRHVQRAAPEVRSAAIPVANPFASLDQNGFRALASRIHANTALLSKFRDRQIDFATIPQEYVRCVAGEMQASLEALATHLCAAAEAPTSRQLFKAEGKPKTIDGRQTFEEAVRNSGLTEEQQRRLLSFRWD